MQILGVIWKYTKSTTISFCILAPVVGGCCSVEVVAGLQPGYRFNETTPYFFALENIEVANRGQSSTFPVIK